MKIITNLLNDLVMEKNEYHSLAFESTKLQMEFRQLLEGFFKKRKGEYDSEYIYFVDEHDVELSAKDFYFINFDCSIINLTKDNSTQKSIQSILLHQLENHPTFIEQYVLLNNYIESFIHSIELKQEDLLVEFSSTKRTMTNFIKSLEVNFEFNKATYVPNYVVRNYLIQTLIQMNMLEKRVFLLITYPETDVGYEDFKSVIDLIKELNVTTLVLTTQRKFLSAANVDNMFLVEKYGTIYNTRELKGELEAFNYFNVDKVEEMTKVLAYHDFLEDYDLMNNHVRDFLNSNKF